MATSGQLARPARRGVRSPLGSGEPWPAGPVLGRASPGQADGRPDGRPARRARRRPSGSPRGPRPHPVACPSSLCCSVSIATAGRRDRSRILGGLGYPAQPGPAPRPSKSVVPKAQRVEGRAPATSKNSVREGAGVGRRGRPAARGRAGLCWALMASSGALPSRGGRDKGEKGEEMGARGVSVRVPNSSGPAHPPLDPVQGPAPPTSTLLAPRCPGGGQESWGSAPPPHTRHRGLPDHSHPPCFPADLQSPA